MPESELSERESELLKASLELIETATVEFIGEFSMKFKEKIVVNPVAVNNMFKAVSAYKDVKDQEGSKIA